MENCRPYNTPVKNISHKRQCQLISRDSYMCELGYFFSLFFGAYLATKFLILMEFEAVEPAWTLYVRVESRA